MSPKIINKQIKRPKKSLPLKTKLEILDRLRLGETVTGIARDHGVNESTIRTIRKSEEKIRSSADSSSNVIKRIREPVMEKMESALNLWIEDRSEKGIQISGEIIQEKAKQIYQYLKHGSTVFQASDTWFNRFKKRYSLDGIKIVTQEIYGDRAAAEAYPKEFLKIIEENGYKPEQVFNVDEIVFFWKRLPQKTFISKQNRVNTSLKDRVTLLMCSNATGNHFIKPMLFFKSLEPQEVKIENRDDLILHWGSNKKTWLSTELFTEWFFNYFVSEVEQYLERIGLEFKVLLVLDNAPCHSNELITTHPNINIVTLPRNTSILLQPISQGISQTFKLNYVKRLFRFILDGMDAELDIIQSWKKFGIGKCLEFIIESLNELKQKGLLNSCWKKLWQDCVQPAHDYLIDTSDILLQIIEIASTIGAEGFDELETEDLTELMKSYDEDVSEADLAEILLLEKEPITTVKTENPKPTSPVKPKVAKMSLKTLASGIKLSHDLCQHFINVDPCIERGITFKMKIEEAMNEYTDEFRQLQSNKPIKD